MLERFSTGVWATSMLLCTVFTIGPAILAEVRVEDCIELPATERLLSLVDEASLFRPLPRMMKVSAEKVALGRKLFGDSTLSKNGTVSCESCHDLRKGGADDTALSTGPDGELMSFNTPSIFNAAIFSSLGWLGQIPSLDDQTDIICLSEGGMGKDWEVLRESLLSSQDYQLAFSALYEDGVTKMNVQNAIADFERSLGTPDSPFDRFLRGEQGALGESALNGFAEFLEHGCSACHQGVGLGGHLLQPLVTKNSPPEDGSSDEWPALVRVPSLRNVALTAPYLHDGSVSTLEEAVQLMSIRQTGRILPDDELVDIIAFLNSLTGKRAWAERL